MIIVRPSRISRRSSTIASRMTESRGFMGPYECSAGMKKRGDCRDESGHNRMKAYVTESTVSSMSRLLVFQQVQQVVVQQELHGGTHSGAARILLQLVELVLVVLDGGRRQLGHVRGHDPELAAVGVVVGGEEEQLAGGGEEHRRGG